MPQRWPAECSSRARSATSPRHGSYGCCFSRSCWHRFLAGCATAAVSCGPTGKRANEDAPKRSEPTAPPLGSRYRGAAQSRSLASTAARESSRTRGHSATLASSALLRLIFPKRPTTSAGTFSPCSRAAGLKLRFARRHRVPRCPPPRTRLDQVISPEGHSLSGTGWLSLGSRQDAASTWASLRAQTVNFAEPS